MPVFVDDLMLASSDEKALDEWEGMGIINCSAYSWDPV